MLVILTTFSNAQTYPKHSIDAEGRIIISYTLEQSRIFRSISVKLDSCESSLTKSILLNTDVIETLNKSEQDRRDLLNEIAAKDKKIQKLKRRKRIYQISTVCAVVIASTILIVK